MTLRRVDGTIEYVATTEYEEWNLRRAFADLQKAYTPETRKLWELKEDRDESE